jgi:3-dehydroquinate synthase
MAVLTVDLGDRSYPIYVDAGLLRHDELIREFIPGSEVMVVSDETIAPLYLDQLLAVLTGMRVTCQILPCGEETKSLGTVTQLFDAMLEASCSRSVTVVALGGGVIGDIAGFVAACYHRGVKFVQIPTTLLAQVDSAVGGKTGINHSLGKNMIGAFHQPRCVIADIDTLDTLESRQVSAGIAEVIKYALIRDTSFFTWLFNNMSALLARDRDALTEAIITCCRIKAELVAADERETGDRVLLNLGHTFGHAIETAAGYGEWLHGEAVAVGMVLAAEMSQHLGWLGVHEVDQIRELLMRANLPVDPPPEMTMEDFLQYMKRDKKVSDGRIRLVLLEAIGNAKFVSDYPESVLNKLLNLR